MLRLQGAIAIPPHRPSAFDHGDVDRASGRVFVAHTQAGTIEVLDGDARQHQVILGFFFGTHLEDPHHLLEGTGARMRHVKVRTLDKADNPALAVLLEAAWLDGPASVAQVKAKRARGRAEARGSTSQATRTGA